MKRLNNSQPLSVAVQYAPLNTSMHIRVEGGLSLFQFYKQHLAKWLPDHMAEVELDANGAQINGPIRLYPEWTIIDSDNVLDGASIVPVVYWFVDGTLISSTDPTNDFFVSDNMLFVRKNFTHIEGANVYCECRFTDTRNNSPQVMADTVVLSAVLQADEQWTVDILCDRTQKFFPLYSASSLFSFNAEAHLGGMEKTNNVKWFWDFSDDNGVSWKDFADDTPWLASDSSSDSIVIDMDFIDNISVRARIAQDVNASSPDLPNEATASVAWRVPNLSPTVYSLGGDKVLANTKKMSFGLHVNLPKHGDMTVQEQRKWILCDWELRSQGKNAVRLPLAKCDVCVSVDADVFRDNVSALLIADPHCSLRGPFSLIRTSSGDFIQTSTGDSITARV